LVALSYIGQISQTEQSLLVDIEYSRLTRANVAQAFALWLRDTCSYLLARRVQSPSGVDNRDESLWKPISPFY